MSSWRNPSSLGGGPLAGGAGLTTSPMNYNIQDPQNGPRAKCDQVVFEAIAKAAEIIVGSRCWIENLPGSNSSSRFNLLVPEVQGVRSILQRWKRALHVPLRLDVYYQHEDSRRELLERWCLEYAPKTTYSFQHGSADPIVQLRQVCKQIVIWLRTLYGWSRMLPAQALRQQNGRGNDNHVGFSIYVVSEGNDDVSGLVSNQGFSTQGQPHSVLTPYGELGWKVFYAPKPMIQQLVPTVPAYTVTTNTVSIAGRATSRPIPMNNNNTATAAATSNNHNNHDSNPWSNQNMHHHNTINNNTSTSKRDSHVVARSAPATQQRSNAPYHRSNSDFGSSVPKQHAPLMSAKMRRNSDLPLTPSPPPTNYPSSPQRQQYSSTPPTTTTNGPMSSRSPSSKSSKPPTKNLSALSLAMMMSDDKNNNTENGETREAAEKRRAALHHAPPQFVNNTTTTTSSPAPAPSPVLKPSNLATAGEYGYGYNNHLPNMKNMSSSSAGNRPSTEHPHYHGSPSPLASTPLSSTPPGYLLAAGPTPPSSGTHGSSSLIPPRSSVTPPFVRPAGFVGEPPSQPLSAPAPAPPHDVSHLSLQQHQTSLDLLHSSPFQQPASVFSIPNTPPPVDSSERKQVFNLSDLRPPGSNLDPRYRTEDFYYDQAYLPQLQDDLEDNEMPFAVDSYSGSILNDKGGGGASAENNNNPLLYSAASGVASFATAPPKRLALFDSVVADGGGGSNTTTATTDNKGPAGEPMDSLADQLAEFKMFGASLMVGGGTNSESSSTSTPISLRT
eukprot:scaffold2654_cov126-Cylindrotheca_fusiformis.AAC.5